MEIEFLISNLSSGNEISPKTNLGVKAQALRHMNIILKNTIEIDVFGMKVAAPSPEAYTIHKMIINSEHGPKAEKDKGRQFDPAIADIMLKLIRDNEIEM